MKEDWQAVKDSPWVAPSAAATGQAENFGGSRKLPQAGSSRHLRPSRQGSGQAECLWKQRDGEVRVQPLRSVQDGPTILGLII